MIGSLAVTEPGGGSDVAGIAHHRRAATATTTSSTAPRRSSPPACAPTSSPPRSAPAVPGHARRSACSSSRRARPASPSTGRWPRWAGTARTPPSSSFADVAGAGRPTWSARRTPASRRSREHFVDRAARAGRARLRHRRRGALALTVALLPGAARRSAGRWSPTRWCGTGSSRCTAGSTWPAPTPARSPRGYVAGEEPARRGAARQGARRSRPRRTSATRRSSCTAAPATCTGPRWSGTTATPGSSASEEARPRCSTT